MSDLFVTVIVVRCHTCEQTMATVPTVARAERVLWDHIDETGHDVTWWTTTEAATMGEVMQQS